MESRILKRDCKKRECNNARKCRKNEDISLYIFEFNTTTIYWAPELVFSRQSLLPLLTICPGVTLGVRPDQRKDKAPTVLLKHIFTWHI